MAIIDGKVLEPVWSTSDIGRRIVVKFNDDADPPAAGSDIIERTVGNWTGLAREYPTLKFTQYISSLNTESVEQRAGHIRSPRLAKYYAMDVPRGVDAEELAQRIRESSDVETAYVEGGPTPPPVSASDDPRSNNQGYLNAAPQGIDARWAWNYADGKDTGFVDLEQGWTLNHQDLPDPSIAIISGINKAYHGHGTAVLGEVLAVDNKLGGIGIAPGATARVVSQWRTNSNYNTADAIVNATAAMSIGNVLLLEAQTSHTNASGYVPVEVERAVFDAIRDAVDAGIVVVEAAGNGSVDLDTFTDSSGAHILNRSSPDFRDSGAIMVGAASSNAPHVRLGFSNFGSRIDCYAWGQSIDTCGDGGVGNNATAYTTSFGGTSGASPIVVGAALILQSWARNRGDGVYLPGSMRALLSDPTRSTPSANPALDRIGVMPDLRAIIVAEGMNLKAKLAKWKLVARILFGVTQDGGGVIFVPGRGPVPVDPWGPLTMEEVTPAVRDALASLAVFELTGLIEDSIHQRAIRRDAITSMKSAVERLS